MTDKTQEIIEGKIEATPGEKVVMDEFARRLEVALEEKQKESVLMIFELTNEISDVCHGHPTNIVMDAVMSMLIHVLTVMEKDDRDEFIGELSDRVRDAVDGLPIDDEQEDSANDDA